MWILVVVGVLAVVVSAAAVALGSGKRTLTAGLVACALTLLSNTVTIVLAMSERRSVAAIAGDPVALATAEYNARNLSKLGLVFGGVAMMLAILALIRGVVVHAKDLPPSSIRAPGKESGDDSPSFEQLSESPRSLVAFVIGSMTVFSLAAAGMPLILPAPKPKVDSKAEAAFRDAAPLLEDGRFAEACSLLEDAIGAGADPKKTGRSDADSMVAECVELYLAEVESTRSEEERRDAERRLSSTKLPLTEEQLTRRARLEKATP
jgi:lysylphosphatidylglycerol synthetase-like protein (DUF2156 family)